MITLEERPCTSIIHSKSVNLQRELSFLKQVLVQWLSVCAGSFSSWKDGSMITETSREVYRCTRPADIDPSGYPIKRLADQNL